MGHLELAFFMNDSFLDSFIPSTYTASLQIRGISNPTQVKENNFQMLVKKWMQNPWLKDHADQKVAFPVEGLPTEKVRCCIFEVYVQRTSSP